MVGITRALSLCAFSWAVYAGLPPHTGSDTPVSAINLTLTTKAPAGTLPINSAFTSFSIEADRWPEWMGVDAPNQYFLNLVNNLKNKTGKAPDFRVGADTIDRWNAWWDPNVKRVSAIYGQTDSITPYPKASNITTGPGYYDLFQRLSPGTRVAITANIYNITSSWGNMQELAKAFANPAMKAKNVTLKWIEVGNEPDFLGYRNMTVYLDQWNKVAMNMSETVGFGKTDGPTIWACGLAHSTGTNMGYSVATIMGNSTKYPAYKYISKVAGHQYNGLYCHAGSDKLQLLMNKPTIRTNLTVLLPDIKESARLGLPYTLGETNTYCGQGGNISNVAGTSLWFVEHALFGATLNIQQMYMHHGVGYKYNLIQPVPLPRSVNTNVPYPSPIRPYVMPNYYGAIIVAEATGSTGTAQILEIPTGNTNRISAFQFYEFGVVKRAVFINSLTYNSSDPAPRQQTHVSLSFNGTTNSPFTLMKIKRLQIRDAYDYGNLTWAGQSYETTDGLVTGSLKTTTSFVNTGFNISATEIVMVEFMGM